LNLWFDFPVHKIDNSGVLKNLSADNMQTPWQKNLGRKKTEKERQEERKESIITAFDACAMGQKEVSVSELAEYLGVTEKTARNRIKEHGGFYIDEGKVGKKPS
ncbi:MAG: DNA primase, partial [Ruminiclostridium sp.]